MNIHNYFPTAILEHQVAEELSDRVEQELSLHIDSLPYNEGFRGNVATDYYSESRIDIFNMFPELITEFINARNTYYEITSFRTEDKINCWVQDYRDETGIHTRHHHGSSGISGVYWVRANEQAGPLAFYNPNTILDYVEADDKNNPYRNMTTMFKPIKGKIILFPSFLNHEVLPSQDGVVRTTIAFNFH